MGMVNGFNESQHHFIAASSTKVLDESMSACKPRTTALGDLPHISYVIRKPEPLGTEFKNAACPHLKVMLNLEIQRGEEPMKQMKYY